jgi:uncharacterized protein (DUF433 family)
MILERFAAGQTEDHILLVYPHLSKEGIRVALAFAAEALQASAVYSFER